MNLKLSFLALVSLTVILAGCSSSGSRSRVQEVRIRYAEVVNVRRVELPSAAPAGAIVGGFTGLILSSGRSGRSQVASGVGGAALGALATRALEGDRLGYQYTLNYRDGETTRFITEKSYLIVGDCVAVEQGYYSNIRRVAQVLCKPAGGTRVAVPANQLKDAAQCQAAKEQLLDAKTSEEIEAASTKVQIICDY